MHGKQPSGLLTQKKMLHSAISLFLEKGYEKATTAEIARGAGMTPSTFFRAYPSKEALLLELVKQMFDNQFAEAERRTGEMDQLMMYAVETALQMHLAELSESMRDLYVTAYSLPSTAAYIYRNTAKRLQTIFSPYLPSLQEKDFTSWILPPAASRAASWPCRAISISRWSRSFAGIWTAASSSTMCRRSSVRPLLSRSCKWTSVRRQSPW